MISGQPHDVVGRLVPGDVVGFAVALHFFEADERRHLMPVAADSFLHRHQRVGVIVGDDFEQIVLAVS